MVKNVKGGSGHKSMARKFTNESNSRKTRVSLDDMEIYASISKLLGGINCMVKCVDGLERMCVIRGKFRGGRGKRSNMLVPGTWVLVGVREWSVEGGSEKEMKKCDLLEVYNDNDKQELKKIRGLNWSFIEQEMVKNNDYDDSGIEFTNNDYQEEYEALMETSGQEKVKMVAEDDEEELVDIDDI